LSPRTILFVDASPAMGGATRVLLEILGALDPRRATPLVVCRPRSAVADAMAERRIPATELDMPVLTFAGGFADHARMVIRNVKFTRALLGLIRTRRPALVHASGLASSLLASLPARLTGVPLVWHAHDMLPRKARNEPFVRAAGAAARAIVCVSKASQARLLEFGVPPGKCQLVYSGVPIPPWPSGIDVRAAGPPMVLAVGTITRQKGQHVLVAAAPELLRRYPDLEIAIVGEVMHEVDRSYLQQLKADVERQGLTGQVRFLGFRGDVASLMERASIVAHPSTAEETLGLVPIEAMAAGLPVVASRIGGLQEVVEDGVSGILVEPGSSASLLGALVCLLDDQGLRASMGAAGRRIAMERFNDDRMRTGLDQVFAAVLGHGVLLHPVTKWHAADGAFVDRRSEAP
jgi:glycosyltransferase involved in cell wall biosynthesis